MSKKLILMGLISMLTIAFIIVSCGRDQKIPVAPIQTTAKIQVDGTDPLANPGCPTANPTVPVGIIPTYVAGNTPTTSPTNVKVTPGDGAETIVYNLDGIPGNDVTIVITVGDCGEVMNWSVPDHIIINHVYAKGGNEYNDYDYTGESPRPTSDGNLHCPTGPSGKYPSFSHMNFVFHYKLTVSKTAVPEYTRTYNWTIDKVGDQTALTLAMGETYIVNYSVTVDATYVDSDWKVAGTITVVNNTPYEAVITSISDVISGPVPATLTCGITFPYTLAAGATLNCTYYAEPGAAVDGTNTVTVVTSTAMVEGGTATADYTFGNPTTYTDECLAATDDKYGALGNVCYADLPKTFNYFLSVGPYTECDQTYEFVNVASFITNDTETSGSDSWTVIVTVPPCDMGCTLTPGYWKTHSHHGKAPEDDAWFLLGDIDADGVSEGADETFFKTKNSQTYYQVLWTAPSGGNAYYILAHQFIAAKLNILNGASSTPEVDAALAWATNFFNAYTPTSKLSKTVSQQAKTYADLIDQYNNGLIGPGHCSE